MASQSPDVKNSLGSMSNDSTQKNSSEKPPIGSGSKRKRVESPSDKVFVIMESVLNIHLVSRRMINYDRKFLVVSGILVVAKLVLTFIMSVAGLSCRRDALCSPSLVVTDVCQTSPLTPMLF